jgi:hypothetical protein
MQFSRWATNVSEESSSSVFWVEDADSGIDTDRFISRGTARNFAYKHLIFKHEYVRKKEHFSI